MKWNHLPSKGAIYDQNPQLIDHFFYIFAERSAFQAAEQAKEQAKASRGKPS